MEFLPIVYVWSSNLPEVNFAFILFRSIKYLSRTGAGVINLLPLPKIAGIVPKFETHLIIAGFKFCHSWACHALTQDVLDENQ